jgi:hypothetical protein
MMGAIILNISIMAICWADKALCAFSRASSRFSISLFIVRSCVFVLSSHTKLRHGGVFAQNLTIKTILGYDCRTAGIPAVGFGSLNHEGVRLRHLKQVGGFFVPCVHQLVGWVRGASARWVYLCDQSSNLHSARLFSFGSGNGVYHKGGLL